MEINKWRNEIDQIDAEIAQLIEYRTAVSRKIGAIKAKSGKALEDEKREREIITRAAARGRNLPADSMARIFQGILDESRRVQQNSIEKGS